MEFLADNYYNYVGYVINLKMEIWDGGDSKLKINICNTVKGFLNLKLLLEREAVTQLIFNNAFVNREKEINKELLFGSVDDDEGKAKLVFANVNPYNLLVYSLDNNSLGAVEVLVDYLITNKINLRGINANKIICDEFIKCYAGKTGCVFKEYLAMDIMELTKLNKEIVLPKGNFRTATFDDKELLIDWQIKFAEEALNEKIAYSEFKEKLNNRIENKQIYIYEDEEKIPRSMAVVARQLVNGISISYVYSSQEARGKGYGLAVVYNLSREYLGRGNAFCSLFVDKHNPISNGVYKKIGYRIIEDNYDYRII